MLVRLLGNAREMPAAWESRTYACHCPLPSRPYACMSLPRPDVCAADGWCGFRNGVEHTCPESRTKAYRCSVGVADGWVPLPNTYPIRVADSRVPPEVR